jgi:hypothetical protein
MRSVRFQKRLALPKCRGHDCMVDTRSSDIKRSARVAIFSGTLVSVVLFLWVYSTRSFFLYWPQAVAFTLAC